MDKLQHFIETMADDTRLKPVHLSLCMALCKEWIASGYMQSYRVNRRLLMQGSRILSKATYHKVLKDLQEYGYLKYTPSYHPKLGSQVSLLLDNKLD